jgi:hypothetical protein
VGAVSGMRYEAGSAFQPGGWEDIDGGLLGETAMFL